MTTRAPLQSALKIGVVLAFVATAAVTATLIWKAAELHDAIQGNVSDAAGIARMTAAAGHH